ncbi:MAG: CRTAC1 family protein [Thermoguttaceae bacterium]
MNKTLIVIGTLVALEFLSSTARGQGKAFSNVTVSSGVEAVVDAVYRASPKVWLSGIDLVDLDGDGKLDLFLSAHSQKGATAALGDGKGHFTYVDAADGTIPPSEIHLAYDINEDGKLDLQMTFNDGGGKWWLNQSTPGHLNFVPTRMDLDGGQARQNAMIDIDRDGKVDWLHEGAHGSTTWDRGDGKGALAQTGKALLSTGWKDGVSMLPVDLNGDGQIDLIMSMRGYEEEHTGRSRVYLNDGKMHFTDATKACGLAEAGLQIMGVGDFNHDGSLDLICLEQGRDVTVYLNDGKGKFTKLPGAVTGMDRASRPIYANWGMAVTVDLDNDGIPDVIMNGRNFLYVLKGTGGGYFACMNKAWGIDDYSDAAVDAGLCFGDIDGDGRIDLLGFKSADYRDQRRVKVYHNDLPKQSYLRVRPIGLAGNKGAAGAKIRVYEAGGLGDATRLVGYEQVTIWARQVCHSYYSYTQTERHFGLGDRQTVDVSVEFYPSGKTVEQKGVTANRTVVVEESQK